MDLYQQLHVHLSTIPTDFFFFCWQHKTNIKFGRNSKKEKKKKWLRATSRLRTAAHRRLQISNLFLYDAKVFHSFGQLQRQLFVLRIFFQRRLSTHSMLHTRTIMYVCDENEDVLDVCPWCQRSSSIAFSILSTLVDDWRCWQPCRPQEQLWSTQLCRWRCWLSSRLSSSLREALACDVAPTRSTPPNYNNIMVNINSSIAIGIEQRNVDYRRSAS